MLGGGVFWEQILVTVDDGPLSSPLLRLLLSPSPRPGAERSLL